MQCCRACSDRPAKRQHAITLQWSVRGPAIGATTQSQLERRPLFDDLYAAGGPSRANYAVAPDGKHFLMLSSMGADSKTIVTENWLEDVKQRTQLRR